MSRGKTAVRALCALAVFLAALGPGPARADFPPARPALAGAGLMACRDPGPVLGPARPGPEDPASVQAVAAFLLDYLARLDALGDRLEAMNRVEAGMRDLDPATLALVRPFSLTEGKFKIGWLPTPGEREALNALSAGYRAFLDEYLDLCAQVNGFVRERAKALPRPLPGLDPDCLTLPVQREFSFPVPDYGWLTMTPDMDTDAVQERGVNLLLILADFGGRYGTKLTRAVAAARAAALSWLTARHLPGPAGSDTWPPGPDGGPGAGPAQARRARPFLDNPPGLGR